MLRMVILVHNVESSFDAYLHKSERSDCDPSCISTGQQQAKVLFFLLYGNVSFRLWTASHSDLFLCWWPSNFLFLKRWYRKRRSLAVFQHTIQCWCFLQFYGNDCFIIDFACVHKYALIHHLQPLLDLLERSGGWQQSHADDVWD